MKRSVNLYQPVLRPQPTQYQLTTLLQWLGICSVILLSLFAVLQWQLQQSKAVMARQQQLISASSEALEDLQQALTQHQPDDALVQQLQQLQNMNQQKRQLLTLLQQSAAEPRPRFSVLFSDLAAADQAGFWLVAFRLSQQDIRFEGISRDARQLPSWLAQMGQNEFLRQRSFQTVSLQSAADGYLQFAVASTAARGQP